MSATEIRSLNGYKLTDETARSNIEKLRIESQQYTNTALSQAKESGEFDGADGYSPIRGIDYWTDADKAEIKSYVDEAILGGAW